MKPTSPNNSVQQRQRLSKSMKKSNKKASPAKSEGTSSLIAVDDTMKAVELGPDTSLKCNFCGKGPASDDLKSGKFYRLHNYSIHFFCLLFAFNGEQKGEDEEGLNGFLVSDVKTQVDKGKKHKCMYCDKPGAMSKCQWSDKKKHACGKWLHFPCGLEAGATFQFLNSMDVYCGKHRVKQEPKLLATTPPDYDCVVCYDEVAKDSDEVTKIVVPCCHRHFHRSCVQNMALASGKHHFKCPNCNNNEIYVDEIEKLGIYVPNADATWETEEHSAFYNYRDMYVQEKRCGAELCVCMEEGRNFHEEDGDFEVVLCKFCGTAGCHVKCGKLDPSDPEFTCKDCRKETDESDNIDDLLNSESDESLGNITLDLSSDASVIDDLSSDASVAGDENEEEDYSDMVIKFLNVHGEMTSSCLKCGHSLPAYQVGPMIEHIKSKHVKSKNASIPSSVASTTSKSESSNIIERLNQLLADDDDAPLASSSTKDDAFIKKFDDESDELDKLLNSVSDGKEAEVEPTVESVIEPTVESVIQNFDDENDELEMLLKEIEDGDGEDNVTEGVNESKQKTATKEKDVDAQDLIVLEDAHLKLQRLLETHKSKVSEVEVPKANKNVPEEVNVTNEMLDVSVEEPVKPKYKPGPKSKKHKLAIITPEPPKPISNSIEVVSSNVAIVKPEMKNPSHMTKVVPAKESTMIFKNTSMKVVSQSSENINIEPLIKSTDKVGKESTSEAKLASIREKIAALQQKTELSSTSVSNLSQVDNKQDLSQPRYRPGPKSRKSKLLVTKSVEKEDDNIVDTSEKRVSGVNADKEIPVATSPSVSVEPGYKPGPKSRKMNSEKEITEVDMTEFDEIINEQNSDSKRSAECLKPGPKSKKLKTQKENENNLTSKYISNDDLQIILGELNKLASDYNDNVFFIGDIKPKERHVIFTFWKVMDRSIPADSLDTLKCEQCNKCFSERCELSEHMSSVCTKLFENIFNIIEQQFIDSSDENSKKKRIFDFIKEKIYSFFGQKWCFLCGKSVRMSTNIAMPSYGLVSHMILCHFKKELSDECKTSKSPFICPITKQSVNNKTCSYKFSSHTHLLSHLAGYHARTDHILRNCTTINNLPGTKPLTKVCKCESCGKDVTNKLSLKFHIAIEKSDYETVEKMTSKKCGEKDCSFQAKFSSEEMIRHFGATHLEIVGGKPINRIKVLPKDTLGGKCDKLNNTLDGLYADSSDDDKIDIVEKVEPRANQDSKKPKKPSLKLVNINKLIQSPLVKESSPCSWYNITTKPSSSFTRSVSTAATQPPPSVKPVPTSKLPSVTPVPTSKLPSVTPVPTSKPDTSALSLKSNRISPAASRRTPSPSAISQRSQSEVRNQTPPPVVLKTPLPTIAEKPYMSPEINKSASKPKGSSSSNKTISTGPPRTASIQAIKSGSKSVKTPSLKKPNPSVPNPTPRILAQTSTTPVSDHASETSSPETSETSSTETPLPTPPEDTSPRDEPSPSPPTSAPSNPVMEAPAPTRRSKRPFSCPICNGNFKTLVILKTHLSNLHFHNRLLARILQNGSTFSCPEDECSFQSNKKEDVTSHITEEHDVVFRIAKELFPNFTTEPFGSAAEKTTTSSDASKNDTPQTTTATESLRNSNVPTDPVHQISTASVLNEVPQMSTTSHLSSSLKRRSTESIETDLKKQKMEKKTTRKVDLPMKPKINVQTATIRPLTRDIVSNKVSSPVSNKISNPPLANKAQDKLPQNVMIIPPAVMENGQIVMQQGQQYFLTQGILPQWSPAGGNNQPWLTNNFQM